jgi:hypothetical protein
MGSQVVRVVKPIAQTTFGSWSIAFSEPQWVGLMDCRFVLFCFHCSNACILISSHIYSQIFLMGDGCESTLRLLGTLLTATNDVCKL